MLRRPQRSISHSASASSSTGCATRSSHCRATRTGMRWRGRRCETTSMPSGPRSPPRCSALGWLAERVHRGVALAQRSRGRPLPADGRGDPRRGVARPRAAVCRRARSPKPHRRRQNAREGDRANSGSRSGPIVPGFPVQRLVSSARLGEDGGSAACCLLRHELFSQTFSPTRLIQPDPASSSLIDLASHEAVGPVLTCQGGLPCRRSRVRVPSSAS